MEKSLVIKLTIAMVLTLFFWSAAFIGIRIGVTEYDPGSLALLRYLVASATMLCFFFLQKNRRRPTLREFGELSLLGFMGFGIYNVLLNTGEVSVPACVSSFIIGLGPMISTLLSIIFLKEVVHKRIYYGMGISGMGLVLIAYAENKGAVHLNLGVAYILLAAFFGSAYSTFQKPLLNKFSPIEVISYAIWIGTTLLLWYTPHLIQEIPLASVHTTLWVIFIGLFPGAIAYLSWAYVVANLPVSKASTFLYGLPFLTIAMGYFVLAEVPNTISFLGGIVCVSGVILVNLKKFRGWLVPNKILRKSGKDRVITREEI